MYRGSQKVRRADAPQFAPSGRISHAHTRQPEVQRIQQRAEKKVRAMREKRCGPGPFPIHPARSGWIGPGGMGRAPGTARTPQHTLRGRWGSSVRSAFVFFPPTLPSCIAMRLHPSRPRQPVGALEVPGRAAVGVSPLPMSVWGFAEARPYRVLPWPLGEGPLPPFGERLGTSRMYIGSQKVRRADVPKLVPSGQIHCAHPQQSEVQRNQQRAYPDTRGVQP